MFFFFQYTVNLAQSVKVDQFWNKLNLIIWINFCPLIKEIKTYEFFEFKKPRLLKISYISAIFEEKA